MIKWIRYVPYTFDAPLMSNYYRLIFDACGLTIKRIFYYSFISN